MYHLGFFLPTVDFNCSTCSVRQVSYFQNSNRAFADNIDSILFHETVAWKIFSYAFYTFSLVSNIYLLTGYPVRTEKY